MGKKMLFGELWTYIKQEVSFQLPGVIVKIEVCICCWH